MEHSDKFESNPMVQDLVVFHNAQLLCHHSKKQNTTLNVEPALSDILFNPSNEEATSLVFDNTKFLLAQRPTSNMILATRLHQRQTLLLTQIFSNCFLLLRFERVNGIDVTTSLQEAISFITELFQV